MLTKERKPVSATVRIRVVEHPGAKDKPFVGRENAPKTVNRVDLCDHLFEFAGNAPATFAERFPRLMVSAVAVAVVLTAITTEIECLRAAGYYWQ